MNQRAKVLIKKVYSLFHWQQQPYTYIEKGKYSEEISLAFMSDTVSRLMYIYYIRFSYHVVILCNEMVFVRGLKNYKSCLSITREKSICIEYRMKNCSRTLPVMSLKGDKRSVTMQNNPKSTVIQRMFSVFSYSQH